MCYSEILVHVLKFGLIEISDQTCKKKHHYFHEIRLQGPISDITITSHTLILANTRYFHTWGILHEFFRRIDWIYHVFEFSHFNRTDMLYLAFHFLCGISCQTLPSKLLIHFRRNHIWNYVRIYSAMCKIFQRLLKYKIWSL